jgi:diguanylate cyclase (GGDEF)-like protein
MADVTETGKFNRTELGVAVGSASYQPEPVDLEAVSGPLSRPERGRGGAGGTSRASARIRERLLAEVEALEHHRAVDVEDRLNGARKLERHAATVRQKDLQMRAVLVRADMLIRLGETLQGARLAKEVNRWAEAHGPPFLEARSHLVLSSTYEAIGDAASGLDHALRAVDLVDRMTPPRVRGNFVMRLGDALARANSYVAARQRYREAARTFISIGDTERHLTALNNLAYAESQAGNLQEAWRVAERMCTLADQSGIPLNPEFLDTLAHAQLGFGKYALAESSLLAALDQLGECGDVQPSTPAQLLLTLARAQRHQERLVAAQDSLDRCLAICVERELLATRVEALREQAELHAANGRFMLAFRLHKTYHEEAMNLSSWQQETRAQARQVMLETKEARNEARRFREQARTDSLTGLKNRRYVDEELPLLLDEVEPGHRQVGAAILDADYFKRINDTLSHDVGDKVIQTIADLILRILEETPSPRDEQDRSCFAARLGGEEYLLVLTGRTFEQARALVESLRESVAAHPWAALTGPLAVTVSAGLAMAEPGDSQADLLRRADQGLYAAKAAGRNRVAVVQGAQIEISSMPVDTTPGRVAVPEQPGQPDRWDGHGRYRRTRGSRARHDTVDLSVVARHGQVGRPRGTT